MCESLRAIAKRISRRTPTGSGPRSGGSSRNAGPTRVAGYWSAKSGRTSRKIGRATRPRTEVAGRCSRAPAGYTCTASSGGSAEPTSRGRTIRHARACNRRCLTASDNSRRTGTVPSHPGVGDRLAVHEARRIAQVLAPVDQERLHHEPDDPHLALRHLLADVARNQRLATVVLLAVAVAGVDHQPCRHPGIAKRVERLAHTARVVVRAALAAAENHVTVGIAARRDDFF